MKKKKDAQDDTKKLSLSHKKSDNLNMKNKTDKKIKLGHQPRRSSITHTPAKGTGKSHKKDRQNWKNQIRGEG